MLTLQYIIHAAVNLNHQVANSVRENARQNECLFESRSQTGSAAFVSECLDYRQFETPDFDPHVTRETLQEMGLEDDRVNTCSSEYDR
jgi:hypothetical protein